METRQHTNTPNHTSAVCVIDVANPTSSYAVAAVVFVINMQTHLIEVEDNRPAGQEGPRCVITNSSTDILAFGCLLVSSALHRPGMRRSAL